MAQAVDLGARLVDIGRGVDGAGAVLDLLGQIGDALLKVLELLENSSTGETGAVAMILPSGAAPAAMRHLVAGKT